ncbi:MAG: sigma-70 family RNA polymerase sigma factor, partial [Calditrichaeota bacterium]
MPSLQKKQEESRLIDRALLGDEKAFAEIIEKYKGQLFSLLFKMVHNKEEAEDLMQEAFMKAFRALGSFNENFAFSTWLYKIAVNNCIDYLRKKRLQVFSYDKPLDMKDGKLYREYADTDLTPEKQLLSSEKSRIINQAIDALPPKYHEVIVLRHREELSYEEIAERLQLPLGTVKARIFRARELLK